jgi:alpha-galactosidase
MVLALAVVGVPRAVVAADLAADPAVDPDTLVTVGSGDIQMVFDGRMHTRLRTRLDGGDVPTGPYRPSEMVVVRGKLVTDFPLRGSRQSLVTDELGPGTRTELTGETSTLRKEVTVTSYQAFPTVLVLQTRYTALPRPAAAGASPGKAAAGPPGVKVDRWIERRLLGAGPPKQNPAPPRQPIRALPPGRPAFWSYQPGSYESRPDWVLPVRPGFRQRNDLGMNATDYGGGTPVAVVWRPDLGVAVGHLERTPRLVSLPVSMGHPRAAELGIEGEVGRVLQPGDSFQTPRTFVAVHRGDHFQPLAEYRKLMARLGVAPPDFAPTHYEPIWCGWGYGRRFTPAQIVATLPKAAELGFKWAVIDDGWQTAEGDWYLDRKKFPAGDADMRALTDRIRAAGLKPMLWWAPLAVDPGTDLHRQHPEYLLLGKDGKPRKISWWNAHYLCPAYAPVKAYTRELATRMLRDWNYDGLKLDGQHLNAAPPCYNPAHGHADPAESAEKLPELFRDIFETAGRLKPGALVELCPCGTAYAFHSMPFFNMPAASDPESSWQVRSKGKTVKALMGPAVPYFGDHVELSEGGTDFASTVGVGGVIGTQFTLPGNGPSEKKYHLTPAREALWRTWSAIYSSKLLSRGQYLGGLYDIGFDRPEAHAIRKDGRLYYAFYARRFSGSVSLRGLEDGTYCVTDYVRNAALGPVRGPQADLAVRFEKHLLLEATPSGNSTCP